MTDAKLWHNKGKNWFILKSPFFTKRWLHETKNKPRFVEGAWRVWSYNLFIRNSTVVINDDYSCSLNLSEIILPKFLKVHGANSLNLSGGLTTLVRVCFIGGADTGSRGMFDIGSVKVLGVGSYTSGLFPFPSRAAATGTSLATSGLTSGTTFVAGFSVGLW